MENAELKKRVLAAASSSARDFSYYGRKDCEHLTLEDLNRALDTKVVTLEEIVDAFRDDLVQWGGLSND